MYSLRSNWCAGHSRQGATLPVSQKPPGYSHQLCSAHRMLSTLFLSSQIIVTRSYAAFRAADLEWMVGPGYSLGWYILEKNHENQPRTMKNHEKPTWNHEKPWKTMKNRPPSKSAHFSWLTWGHNWPSWHSMRKWSFFVTYAGSQMTFMTQNEKVHIFRDFRVTTDLLDV